MNSSRLFPSSHRIAIENNDDGVHHEQLEIRHVENLLLRISVGYSPNSAATANSPIEEDADRDENDLFPSPSSPRMTIHRIPTRTKRRRRTLSPISLSALPSPRPSQLQKQDKLLFVETRDLPSSLQLPYLPSLPLDHMDSAAKTKASLSRLPLPPRIRLLPRRQKSSRRNRRN